MCLGGYLGAVVFRGAGTKGLKRNGPFCRYELWAVLRLPGRGRFEKGIIPLPTLIHLIYASVATQAFGTGQLTDLLRRSREANERAELTGMLLFSEGNFFQVLEGEPEAVDKLYEKLGQDKRHAQVTLIIREGIASRSFGDWSMGFSSISPEDLKKVDGLNDFFQGGSCFAQLDAGRAKKLLAAFGSGRWRANLMGPTRLGV